ncbi:hypothetical protein CWE08_09370 [Aliidiomarina iranensis]|uniref:Uncharacterized protein n=1 Tax=Aliidiomarina iranensis TaxID=1434071 RepID=A0A432VT51_9GAMM|nr:hypothetical protein [Aliidiomarina iranensis]RUO19631.1 hypothetical protein CWE08_09370 [Aliidiomarina iranensis]
MPIYVGGYLHTTFNLTNENGVSDRLSGRCETQQVIKAFGVENLDFIVRGAVPPNPSELIMHERLASY